jgi:hypothetical protein
VVSDAITTLLPAKVKTIAFTMYKQIKSADTQNQILRLANWIQMESRCWQGIDAD